MNQELLLPPTRKLAGKNAQPTAVLFRFPDEDTFCQDAALLLVLGEGAPVLAERLADYAQSLPDANWMKALGRLAAVPQLLEHMLPLAGRLPCIIAISGALTHEDLQFAAQLFQVGGHCTVVVDATTEIRLEWTSVIRLPPHRSRDAQWASAMRVYLNAMLNRGLICLDTYNIQACTQNRLSQFTMVQPRGERRTIVGVKRAVLSLAKRCDLHACDTFILLFHCGPDIKIKELHSGIQAFKSVIKLFREEDDLLMVGHIPDKNVSVAISLMAGMPCHQ